MNRFVLAVSATAALIACGVSAPAWSQAAAPTSAPKASSAAKAKPSATKAAASEGAAKSAAAAKPVARAPVRTPHPKLARGAVKAVEEVTPVDTDTNVTLSEDDLAVAQRVFVGPIKCELGANVTVTADEKRPGFFIVQTQRVRYRMHPVESRTGAIRLEDPRAGAIWLQLGNKSMLMNQKIGERLADECQSPQQVTFADEMKKNPPKSLLEPLDPTVTTTTPTTNTTTTATPKP